MIPLQLLFVSVLISSALAETVVTTVFLPGFANQSLIASVIAAVPTATTYFVKCGTVETASCDFGDGATVVDGPSTFQISVDSTEMTISEACAISSDTAACTYILGGPDPNSGGSSGNESATGLESMSLPITITAGFEALASASAAAKSESTMVRATATDNNAAAGTSTTSALAPAPTLDWGLLGFVAVVGGVLVL